MLIDETSYKYSDVPDGLVLPRSSYHKLYAKRSRVKHVLFAIGVVILLVSVGLLLKLNT
jgi:hypothetical protein